MKKFLKRLLKLETIFLTALLSFVTACKYGPGPVVKYGPGPTGPDSELSDLVATPSTISIGDSILFTETITLNNGETVEAVTLTITNPSEQGTDFVMVDDGTEGDLTPNDGTYAATVSQTDAGYPFQAAGEYSAGVTAEFSNTDAENPKLFTSTTVTVSE